MSVRGWLAPVMAFGLAFLFAALSWAPARAGEAETKAEAPAQIQAAPEKPAQVERPAGHVGTVVAVNPSSQTLVVDVPLGEDVLRVGAWVTDKTRMTAGGKAVSLDRLKAGDRVRIEFRRIDTGDEAIAVQLLRPAKG